MAEPTMEDFDAFFCDALREKPGPGPCSGAWHPGHIAPYAWQRDLLERVCGGAWPEQIAAPTAAGKTAVVEVHTFVCALAAVGALPQAPPRRLALVVDRRALVDDQHLHARRLADRLEQAWNGREDSAMRRVAAALARWRWRTPHGASTSPLLVARLRGGVPPDRDWLHDPTAAAVLCCTPDMFGSRLLFRGYGSSRRARPREAGLLGLDTVAVIDEAHLNRQLLHTARRVRQLQQLPPGGPPARRLTVVETTATPTTSPASVVAVDPGGLGSDELVRRMQTPKPVHLLHLQTWPFPPAPSSSTAEEKKSHRMAQPAALASFIDAAADLRRRFGPTVAVYVNTVAAALEAARELRGRTVDGRPLRVQVLCGRMRRHDYEQVLAEHPGLLMGTADDDSVDVLVCTQTLEVGVDADFSSAISELAPASALAQRSGRVNRRGRRPDTTFTVAVPSSTGPDRPPYDGHDLAAAVPWLQRRSADPRGLAPITLVSDPPGPPVLRRTHLQRLELADTWQFARTGDDLAADLQPALWIEDDLEADDAVGLVARSRMPCDPADAARLVRDLGIDAREVYPVAMATACDILAAALIGSGGPSEEAAAAVIRLPGGVSGEAVPLLDPEDLAPGDIVVLDAGTDLQVNGVVVRTDTPDRQPGTDILEYLQDRIRYRLEPGPEPDPRTTAALQALSTELAAGTGRRERDAAAAVLASLGDRAARTAALLRGPLFGCDLALHTDAGGAPIRLLVVERPANTGGDRQERSARATPVPLDEHGRAVGRRADELALRLLIEPGLRQALVQGGLIHDLGKQDARFQARLGADMGSAPLAKSGARAMSGVDPSGLPAGWRHEQLSVLLAAARGGPHRDGGPGWHDLALRLAGTSHGHGRTGFPHSAAELLDTVTASADPGILGLAERLFDDGEWDSLVETTDRWWGAWGCAYLEALLRAADAQVSAEGS